MAINKLQAVMWHLRKLNKRYPTNDELQRTIMYEIGTDPRTINNARKALIKLQWIQSHNSKRIELTGKDITG